MRAMDQRIVEVVVIAVLAPLSLVWSTGFSPNSKEGLMTLFRLRFINAGKTDYN